MEVALNILLSLVLALVVSTLLVMILRRRETAPDGLSFHFPVIFLFLTTAGLWSQPGGTTRTAEPWLAQLVAGAVVLLTALVFQPRRSGTVLRLLSSETGAAWLPGMGAPPHALSGSMALRQNYLGMLFLLLVIVLLAGGVAAYLLRR